MDNFSTIADWRATLLRVANFRRAVVGADVIHRTESRISLLESEPGAAGAAVLVIDDLEIASPAGCVKLQGTHVEVKGGDRVLVIGEPGAGKTLLFRALAGLWPWGAGRIVRPRGQSLYCMPRTPYLPRGTLADVLAYPMQARRFEAQQYAKRSRGSGWGASSSCSARRGAGTGSWARMSNRLWRSRV